MVTPDPTRFEQDRAPGLVRRLHESLTSSERVYRNLLEVDYEALVQRADFLLVESDEGYLFGAPHGRQLRLYYDFSEIDAVQAQLGEMVVELSELALKRTACQFMTLDYDDHGNRHKVHLTFLGADFTEPEEWTLLRCRDVRPHEMAALRITLPTPLPTIRVREATPPDLAAITDLEVRVRGEGAIAPPLPEDFLAGARAVLVAESDGRVAGYLRLASAGRRDMQAEEFTVDPEGKVEAVETALLSAAFAAGAEAEGRCALNVRVPTDHANAPVFRRFALKRAVEGLAYRRPVDPAEVERRRQAKIQGYLKVGKIWGTW